ncbi:DUF6542 domain-containing protein [Streptomyces griseoviridis]|uniref:Membrane protein n=1 Tax=Streptomyces griseoviridis TaxID=45398 RepID=A0A918LAC7_STRGD|nr:DUF6542 domain-containing protein [Streptomyces niveoruber]GGS26056.1 membrane protein [Streptomyces niveoruber]
MEQHRTRPAQYGPRRGRPPLPPQGRGPEGRPRPARAPGPDAQRSVRGGAPRGPVPSPAAPPLLRRLPNPRLTGLGGGLFCAAVMLASGFLDQLLFGSSRTVYGVLFLPACVLTAVWVRRGDLLTAPIVVPIAFAVGLTTVADGGDGFTGALGGFVTALAMEAGWLYGGTLIAGTIVIVRRIRLVRRRVAARERGVA